MKQDIRQVGTAVESMDKKIEAIVHDFIVKPEEEFDLFFDRQKTVLSLHSPDCMVKYLATLCEWTGKKDLDLLYSSTINPSSLTAFHEKVHNKAGVAVVEMLANGEVVGGFCSVPLDGTVADPDMFIFSLDSNGRYPTPRRFPVKQGLRDRAYVALRTFPFESSVVPSPSIVFGVRGPDEPHSLRIWHGYRKHDVTSNLRGGFEGLDDEVFCEETNQILFVMAIQLK